MATVDGGPHVGEARRPSIEKKPTITKPAAAHGLNTEPPAFGRLPDEIIQQYAPALI